LWVSRSRMSRAERKLRKFEFPLEGNGTIGNPFRAKYSLPKGAKQHVDPGKGIVLVTAEVTDSEAERILKKEGVKEAKEEKE